MKIFSEAMIKYMTSIKDIARLAGVSPSTVSRVLNEREYVRDEVRQRVLSIVKEKRDMCRTI